MTAMLAGKLDGVAEPMPKDREDVLACAHFPPSHWRKL
jgi:hypothetical protein